MSSELELPRFLHGCFDWQVNGLHWDQAPDIDLLLPAALENESPWILLAAVVERAKRGDHREAGRLARFAGQDEPFALGRVALLALADIGSWNDLDVLEGVLRGDNSDARVDAAEAASLSGALKFLPAMVSAWQRAESTIDRDVIGFSISHMLEPAGGPIADVVGWFDFPTPTESEPESPVRQEYRRQIATGERDRAPLPGLVADAHSRLEKALGPRGVVWEGRPMNIVELAQKFLSIVKSDERHNFIDLRHRFESYTGIDCRKFYFAMEPQRLQMAAVLEDFLNSREATRYEPGRRYFFGHPIPE